jgi:FAD dependent oxidoreductase
MLGPGEYDGCHYVVDMPVNCFNSFKSLSCVATTSCQPSPDIMASKDRTSPSVLILGAGCFGLATAYHLVSNGYSNVTVLDKADTVPSRFSAGFDLNKVVRAEYHDPFYTELSLVSGIYNLFHRLEFVIYIAICAGSYPEVAD